MDSLLHQQTVFQIQQLKDNYALRQIDDWAYTVGRARILDHYMHVSDHQEDLALTTTRLQRLNSFSPYLGPQEVAMEWQRMCRQDQHPPIIQQCPVPLLPAPLIPPLPGVFGRGCLQPPHDPPAVVRKKPYEAIYPGTAMLLNQAKAFLEVCFLPFLMKSKGGGQNGRLMFCCRRADCTLVCRLVPVPHADPPLFIAEVNRNFNIHTNHNADEYENRQNEIHAQENFLGGQHLHLNEDEDALDWILKHIDCFVTKSRGNESVEEVTLYPYSVNGYPDTAWDKLGQAIGNLQALGELHIRTPNYHDDDDSVDYDSDYNFWRDDDEVVPIPDPDWEILARILSHVRQKITLTVNDENPVSTWRVEDSRSFARAIHGHPTITGFEASDIFAYEDMDALYTVLATMPALESIELSSLRIRPDDESALAHPESLTELLRVPSLRSVSFYRFYFTRALCQATANALIEGTAVTELKFKECAFPAGECAAIMASGLSRNTSVSHINVMFPADQALFDALAAALPLNSMLQDLSLILFSSSDDPSTHFDWSPIFLALGKNTGLKTLKVDYGLRWMDESLSTAIKDGLELNGTLWSLEFCNARLTDDNSDLWCRAFSFLRTNKALNSLIVHAQHGVKESCLSVFRIDIVTMLQENAALENLSILTWNAIKAEECIVLLTALQLNTTLKTLRLQHSSRIRLTDDEDKQMAALLKKKYAIERLDLEDRVGDADAILRLNRAGRRYLIEDGSSISKGVEVLSRVNNVINCVFFHLLENPRLCDRTAVEAPDADESNGHSTSPTANDRSDGGKREQVILHKGRESRRRLT
jgi:hypothetical protein